MAQEGINTLPSGWAEGDDGSIVFAPGASKAPVLRSRPTEDPKPLNFDDRLRRYYGEDMSDSLNPLNPLIRGYMGGLKGEVGRAIDFGEVLTDSDYLQQAGKAWSDEAAKIPQRGFSSAFTSDEDWDLSDWGGWVAETVGQVAGQFTPYIALTLVPSPDPATKVTGVVGGLSKLANLGNKALSLGATTKKARFGRQALVGMGATMTGGAQREIRDVTGVENRPLALAAGMVQSGLNYLPLKGILNNTGTGKRFFRDILVSQLGGSAIKEGLTEAAQEGVQLGTNWAASRLADQTYNLATPENFFRLVDAAAAGVVGGATMGGVGAYGNYLGNKNPSPEEDAAFLDDVKSVLTPDVRRDISDQSKLKMYEGFISSIERSVNNPERYFSQEEITDAKEFIDKADILNESDDVKSKLKERLSKSLSIMQSRQEIPEVEEVSEPSELEKAAAELKRNAEKNSGVSLEGEKVSAEVERDVKLERQRAIDSSTAINPMPLDLAPYKEENIDLDYTAASRRGAVFLHQTEMGLIPAAITKIDPETERVIEAKWDGLTVLDEEGPHITAEQIYSATERSKVKEDADYVPESRSDVEDINEVVFQVAAEGVIKKKVQEANKIILDQMKTTDVITTPGVTDPRDIQLLQASPKVPAEVARNIPSSMLTPQQRKQRLADAKKQPKKRVRRSRSEEAPTEAPIEVKTEVKSEPKTRVRRSRATDAGTRATGTPKKGKKAKTEVTIADELAKAEATLADVKNEKEDAGRKLRNSATKIFIPEGGQTNSFLFVAPINFDALTTFVSSVSSYITSSIKQKYLEIIIKNLKANSLKNPTDTEVLSGFRELFENQSNDLVRIESAKNLTDPAQLAAIQKAIFNYWEDSRKLKGKKKSLIANKETGEVSDWVKDIINEITIPDEYGVPVKINPDFIKWINENEIQIPRGPEYHKIKGRSEILPNADKIKNLVVSGVDGGGIESAVLVKGPDADSGSNKLYNDNGSSTDSYLSFKTYKNKNVVTIHALDVHGKPFQAYSLKDSIAKGLKSDPYVKNKKTKAFVYIPYDLIWDENGDFISKNWDRKGKKSQWKYESDQPHGIIDKQSLYEKLSYIFESSGSEGLAKRFRDYNEGLAELNGYIDFARSHEKLDKSKDFKPRNIYDESKHKKGQISKLTSSQLAVALRESIRAASDRAIQDSLRGVREAESVLVSEFDTSKGMDTDRRYRNDQAFKDTVLNSKDVTKTNLDRFIIYRRKIEIKLNSIERSIREQGDRGINTADLRKQRDSYKDYIADADKSLEKVFKFQLGKNKHGDFLTTREKIKEERLAEKGDLKTVGSIPVVVNESKIEQLKTLQKFLRSEVGEPDFSELESKAFAYTEGIYRLPIISHAVAFQKEITKMVDEDFAQHQLTDGDPNSLSFQPIDQDSETVVPQTTEVTDYSDEYIIDEEMEKDKASDNARVRGLKSLNARTARSYRDSLDINDMERVEEENPKAVIAHDIVDKEVFDGDTYDSLPSIARNSSEKAVAKLTSILVKNNILKESNNGADEFSELYKRLGSIPQRTKGAEKVQSKLDARKDLVKSEKQKLERNNGITRLDSEGRIVRITVNEYSSEDSGLPTLKEAKAFVKDQVEQYENKLKLEFAESVTFEDIVENNIYNKEYEIHSEIKAVIALAYGRGRRVLKSWFNSNFDWDVEKIFKTKELGSVIKLLEEAVEVTGLDKSKADAKINAFKKRFETPWSAFDFLISQEARKYTSSQRLRSSYLRHQLRSFRNSNHFTSKFDDQRLFTTLMKLAIEYNEGTILDKFNRDKEANKLPVKDYKDLHFKVKTTQGDFSALDLFVRFKAVMENPNDVISLIEGDLFQADNRYNNEDVRNSKINFYVESTKIARSELVKPIEPKKSDYDFVRTPSEYEIATESYKRKLHNYNHDKKLLTPNRQLRRQLLIDITDDLVTLISKQAGMDKKLFRSLMKIRGQGGRTGTTEQIARSIDGLIEGTEGAYGRSEFESGPSKEGVDSLGTFEYIPEIFETVTARKAVPQKFLSDKRFTYRSGRTGSMGKLLGKPADTALVSDRYEVLDSATGPDGIKTLIQSYSSVLPEGMVNRGLELLDIIPDKYLKDLTFEVSEDIVEGGLRLSGKFHEFNGRVTAAINLATKDKDGADSDIVHEISHSLFSFLDQREVGHIKSMRLLALKKLSRNAGTTAQKIVADKLINNGADMDTNDWFRNVVRGLFPDGVSAPAEYEQAFNSIYPLINDSEYFVHMMTEEGKLNELSKLPYVSKSRIEAIYNKVKEIFNYIKNLFTGDLKESIVNKFKKGEFSSRRRSLGAKTFGKFEYKNEVERAMEAGYRGGANKEAAELISAEAGASAKLLTDLIEDALVDLASDDRYSALILDEDGNINPSARIKVNTQLKRNKEISQYLDEFSDVTGSPTFSPKTYLEMSRLQKNKKTKVPDSMWEVVSRNVALNFEYFINGYQKIIAKRDKLDGDKDNLAALQEETKLAEYDKNHVAKLSKDARARSWELLKQADVTSKQGEAARLLQGFGFSLNQISSQINDTTLNKNLSEIISDMYETLHSTSEGRKILFNGRGWSKMLTEYRRIKSGEAELESLTSADVSDLKKAPRKVKDQTVDDIRAEYEKLSKSKPKFKVDISPMHRLAAWHIRVRHDIDKKQLKIADDIDKYASEKALVGGPTDLDIDIKGEEDAFYSSYETWFEDLQTSGSRSALTKLLSALRSNSKKEVAFGRLYLTKKRELAKKIKDLEETRLSAAVLESVVNSEEFKSARSTAVQAVNLKPNMNITYEKDSIFLPNPPGSEGDAVTVMSTDTGTKETLETQLGILERHIENLNKWIEGSDKRISIGRENLDDVFNPFWVERRDQARALLNSNTTRAGGITEKSKILNLGKLGYFMKGLDNFLSDVGGYQARVSRQELYNYIDISERSEDWRKDNENEIMSRIYDAAESHGYDTDTLGVARWHQDIGQEYFALSNQAGRKIEVGESFWSGGEERTITKQDYDALNYQSGSITKLYDLNLKELRGDIADSREVEEEVKGKRIDPRNPERKKQKITLTRKPIRSNETILPKTFRMDSVTFAQQVNSYYQALIPSLQEIDNQNLPDDISREMKLSIFKEVKIAGKKSLYDLVGSQWRFVEAFLGNREGKITSGSKPYFANESIYDDARELTGRGEITSLNDLGNYFAGRSIDLGKMDKEIEEGSDTDLSLTNEEATYELMREMISQIRRVHLKINPEGNSSRVEPKSRDLKILILKEKNSFNTARQEPIANWFFYDYGIHQTNQLAKIVSDSGSQYLEKFESSLDSVKGYLVSARVNIDEKINNFNSVKAREAASGDNFIKYETLSNDIAKLESLMGLLEGIKLKDQKYEQVLARGTVQTAYNDFTAAALASIVTAWRNLIGTPTRTFLRMNAIFGFSPRLAFSAGRSVVEGILETGATFGIGALSGAKESVKVLAKGDEKGRRIKPAIKTFLKKSLDEAFAKELLVGQFKINENLAHITDKGYGIRIDSAGRFDNWFRNLETRGRIEREEELKTRRETRSGRLKKRMVEAYNATAFFGVETLGYMFPRLGDMTGNNSSFRMANVILRELDARLKKMHDLHKDNIWKWYNVPDKSFNPDKGDVISPMHLWGTKFFGLGKQNETSMKHLEDLFGQSGLDFHKEALLYLRQLDSDKNANFLDADKTGKLGISLFAENSNTIASRSLETRNNPYWSNMMRLLGWSVAAFHNTVQWQSRSIKGNTKWWALDGLRFQQMLSFAGFLTISAGATAATEEMIKWMKRFFYGEVAPNRHPWEEEDLSGEIGGWVQYSFAAFPIFNIPLNAIGGIASGTAPRSASGIEFFWQSLIKRGTEYAVGVAQTRDPLYRFDYLLKSTFGNPIPREIINQLSSVSSGRVSYMNNRRLIRKFIDKDYAKPPRGGYGGGSATPVSPHIDAMVSYALTGQKGKFKKEASEAIRKATELKKEDPAKYVRGLYWGRDPWASETRGTITFKTKRKVQQRIQEFGEEWLNDFKANDRAFNLGYTWLGGTPNRIKLGDASSYKIPVGRDMSSTRGRANKKKNMYEEARKGFVTSRKDPSSSSDYGRSISKLRRAYGG